MDRITPQTGDHPAVRRHPEGVIVTLLVQPGARRNEVVAAHGDTLKVKVTAPPVDGKANDAVIVLLADLFGRRPREVSLVAGVTARRKEVLIGGIEATAVAAAIETALGDATLQPAERHR